MHRPRFKTRHAVPLFASLLLSLAVASSVPAHVTKSSGSFRVELGWGSEPPLSGLDNSVEILVTDSAGAPLAVPAGALSVEVTFAGSATTLPLEPAGRPGELRAALVPTRPGVYGFHVSGAVEGQTLDVSATCSESTFECVGDGAAVEFPARDPSRGELAQRLKRESDRVAEATDSADVAKRTATLALALAVVALAGSAALAFRRRRKSGSS